MPTDVQQLPDWVAQLRAQNRWQLPQQMRLHAQRPPLTPQRCAVGAAWLLLGALELWWRQSALVWMCLLVAAPVGMYWHAQRHPRARLQWAVPFAGSWVDVAAQRVHTQGLEQASDVHLHPAQDWSVGVYRVITQRVAHHFIELRHVRRGPVLVLCELVSHTPLSAPDVASIDEAVDVMAERLGVRRTGTRLVRAKDRQSRTTGAASKA